MVYSILTGKLVLEQHVLHVKEGAETEQEAYALVLSQIQMGLFPLKENEGD